MYAITNITVKTAIFAAIISNGLSKSVEKSFTITLICCVYKTPANFPIVSFEYIFVITNSDTLRSISNQLCAYHSYWIKNQLNFPDFIVYSISLHNEYSFLIPHHFYCSIQSCFPRSGRDEVDSFFAANIGNPSPVFVAYFCSKLLWFSAFS